jgi:hypothetical protein
MLVIVAVNTEVLPVRPIGRVILVIPVPVMYCQQVEAGLIKLPAAFGADRSMDLERFCPVVAVTVNLSPHPREYGSGLIGAGECDCSGAS